MAVIISTYGELKIMREALEKYTSRMSRIYEKKYHVSHQMLARVKEELDNYGKWQ